MPYGHLIAATVMTLSVCQGHSSIARFFSILTSASRGPSAIAELLANDLASATVVLLTVLMIGAVRAYFIVMMSGLQVCVVCVSMFACRIASCMCSLQWWHCPWTWMTANHPTHPILYIWHWLSCCRNGWNWKQHIQHRDRSFNKSYRRRGKTDRRTHMYGA